MAVPSDPPTTTPSAFGTWAQNVSDTAQDHETRIAAVEGATGTYTYATGMWYPAPEHTHSTAGAVQSDGFVSVVPFQVKTALTVDRLAVEVTSGGSAGSLLRLGIYDDDGGLPGALLLDAGTVDSTATGALEATVNQALDVGLKWFACVAQGTPSTEPTVRIINAVGGVPWSGGEDALVTLRYQRNGWFKSGVTGALADPFGTPTGDAGSAPVMAFRVA